MTKAKPWPRNAEWARLDALSKIDKAIGDIHGMILNISDPVVLQKAATTLRSLYDAKELLILAKNGEVIYE